jgi:hypothetical protein
MSITYIIGSRNFINNDSIMYVSNKIIEEGRKNGKTYKICDSLMDIKNRSDKEHVIRIKNSELTYQEEDFLESYRGQRTLFLLNDNIMHDWWLLSFFGNVYLCDPNTGNYIIRKRSKL